MKVSGTSIGVIELVLFFFTTTQIRNILPAFDTIDKYSYHWLCFTVLTCIWELTYLTGRDKVRKLAYKWVNSGKHVWTSMYGLDTLIPWKLSKQFYTEYGAYADREYITKKNGWSLMVEGSHCIFCGFFAAGALISKLLTVGYYYQNIYNQLYNILMSISMSSQFMNSLLYMSEYFVQTNDPNSINYNTPKFPCGFALLKRPFMWINAAWLIMPVYVFTEAISHLK